MEFLTNNSWPAHPIVTTVGLLIYCAAAGWLDLSRRRIPNWLCAITAFSGLFFALTLSLDFTGIGSQVLHMGVALIAGMTLFALGMFGGGDAKFYAAVAAWFPISDAFRLIGYISLAGLILLFCWFIYRRAKGYPIQRESRSDPDFASLPYGLAIGAGAIASMVI